METIRQIFQVDRKAINYLRVTIESYDGMAIVRTLDPQAAVVEILISPGCEDLVFELLDYLNKEERMNLEPRSVPVERGRSNLEKFL